mmetsp:Transcript_25914/g.38387  ORF Transcript_25914/g.38387 Transcript_25914/m.38387 type:complete len:337 (-) Transcript_25914:100-1110(-)
MSNASLVLLTLSPTIENNENEDADFVSPLAKVIAVSWLAFLVACCYMYQKQESIRQEREEIERIAEIRRNERDKKLKPKERLNIIANKILQKTIVKNVRRKGSLEILFNQGNEDSDSDAGTEATIITNTSIDNNTSQHMNCHEICQDVKIMTSVPNDVDETEHLTCSVCLEAFEAGDTLSWSKDLQCKHVFHGDCLLPWLMKNDDCPMCRATLIQDADYDDNKGSDENERVNDAVGSIRIVNGLISYVGRVREAPGFSRLLSRSKDDDGDDMMAKVIPLKANSDTDSDTDKDAEIENAFCNKEKKITRSKRERQMTKNKYCAVQTRSIVQDAAEEC